MTPFRLGRNKLPALPPMLRVRNYLLASLPPPVKDITNILNKNNGLFFGENSIHATGGIDIAGHKSVR